MSKWVMYERQRNINPCRVAVCNGTMVNNYHRKGQRIMAKMDIPVKIEPNIAISVQTAPKAGFKTSELWLTVATVLGLFAIVPLAGAPVWIAGVCAALSTAAYTVSRAYAKANDGTDKEVLVALTSKLAELESELKAKSKAKAKK